MTSSDVHEFSRLRSRFAIVAAGVLLLVALVYWPARQAWFVWDDKILIHDNAWLSVGSGWQSIVFHGISDWRYFRPLGLLLMVAETRCFGVTPGPMHLVSLVLHLFNTALVGSLALRLSPLRASRGTTISLAACAMMIYGLHPVLVEPVAWIASQFDLLVTLFMLLGLLLNLTLKSVSLRATLVAACFFLAACAKESAMAFPVLVLLLDWMQQEEAPALSGSRGERLRTLLFRQLPVYAAIFSAGIAYLILRYWARGVSDTSSSFEPIQFWQRTQTVCYCILTYLKMIVFPFVGLAPVHIVPAAGFSSTTAASIATDIAATFLLIFGLVLSCRGRRSGVLILAVIATVFPVLHVIPVDFDDSLYHDRYAAPAIAMTCVLLPGLLAFAGAPQKMRLVRATLYASIALWLALAAITIRTTLPLWSNDALMWNWALRANPGSIFVVDHLFSTYIDNNDRAHADELSGFLMTHGRSCANCMENVADLALFEGDNVLAAKALQYANDAFKYTPPTHTLIIGYVLLSGNLHQANADNAGAEEAYRGAIALDPMRTDGYFCLSLLLAKEGKADAARKTFDKVIALSAKDSIGQSQSEFAAALAQGSRSSRP